MQLSRKGPYPHSCLLCNQRRGSEHSQRVTADLGWLNKPLWVQSGEGHSMLWINLHECLMWPVSGIYLLILLLSQFESQTF